MRALAVVIAAALATCAGCVSSITRYTIPRTPPPEGFYVTVNKGSIAATDHVLSATSASIKRGTDTGAVTGDDAVPRRESAPADKKDEGPSKKSDGVPPAPDGDTKGANDAARDAAAPSDKAARDAPADGKKPADTTDDTAKSAVKESEKETKPVDAKDAAADEKARQATTDSVRTGRSSSQGVLGLVAWGDSSIRKAADEAKITRVHSVDYERVMLRLPYFNWLIYESLTVIVTGD
ncbi:MAG TPA: TRL domain-containing protein [Spirochaetota bacterium]|nr:TRL domain-containing protein [Spirochaetota bacterium]